MDYRKAYWFEQPHMPGMFNVAVQPIVDPRDGRLHFAVPDSGIWALTGKVIKDTGDYFEFECNDSVMGARGGTYKFSALDIKTFRKETWKWIAQGKDIAGRNWSLGDGREQAKRTPHGHLKSKTYIFERKA